MVKYRISKLSTDIHIPYIPSKVFTDKKEVSPLKICLRPCLLLLRSCYRYCNQIQSKPQRQDINYKTYVINNIQISSLMQIQLNNFDLYIYPWYISNEPVLIISTIYHLILHRSLWDWGIVISWILQFNKAK